MYLFLLISCEGAGVGVGVLEGYIEFVVNPLHL